MPKKTQKEEGTAQSEPLEMQIAETLTRANSEQAGEKGYPLIFSAMVNIMTDMDAISKSRQSKGQGNFNFRGIDEVMNAMHPLFVKHGVIAFPIIEQLENKVFEQAKTDNNGNVTGSRNLYQAIMIVRYRFIALDGSSVDAKVCAESSDYSDKATQQALSYCYKVAMLQVFSIPTIDMSDGDERTLPDTSGRAVQAQTSRLDIMPKLADRPPISIVPKPEPALPESEPIGIAEEEEPEPVALSEPASAPEPELLPPPKPEAAMTEKDWEQLRKVLVPLNISAQDFHHWSIKTLRANNLPVPGKMIELPKSSGKVLWQVAVASSKAGQLLTDISPAA